MTLKSIYIEENWGNKEKYGKENKNTLSKLFASVHACAHAHLLSRVRLFATLWTVAGQAPLSMGFPQARILEWIAMLSSREFSRPRDPTHVAYISCIGRWVLYH